MRRMTNGALCLGVGAVCVLASATPARGAVPEAAKRLKDRAVEYITDANEPDVEKAAVGRKALNSLKVAKMILDKSPRPHAGDVRRELEDVSALDHWVRRKLMSEPRGPRVGSAPEAALLLRKARDYARDFPDRKAIAKARFFEVEDKFHGTPASDEARAELGGAPEPDPVVALPAPTPRRVSGSVTLVDGLGKALANPTLSARQKLDSCERIIRSMSMDDPLRREVQAVREILAASDARSRSAAVEAYKRAHAGGRLASQISRMYGGSGEGPDFDALMTKIGGLGSNSQKAAACREFLKRGGASPRAPEARAMLKIYSAKYEDDKATAYLEYAMHFPAGPLRDEAIGALRRSESRLIRELKLTLAHGEIEEFRLAADVHKELFPRSQVRREVRSMMDVLEEPADKRIRAAEQHTRTYRKGYLTEATKDLIVKWRASKATDALADVEKAFAGDPSREKRAGACKQFLRAYPHHDAAAEIRAAQLMVSLSTAKARLEAVRKYVAKYPQGRFVGAARRLEGEFAVEMDDELYRSVKLRLEDSRAPYAARLSACESYLEEMPNGRHAAKVREAAQGVRSLIANEQAAYDRLVAGLKGVASLDRAIARCEGFITSFPAGPHVGDVTSRKSVFLRRQAERRESDAFEALTKRIADLTSSGKTNVARAEACLAFLREYPRGEHRGRAVLELKRFAATPIGPHDGPVRACAFSRDSRHLITCDADAGVSGSGLWVWTLPDAKLVKILQPRPGLTATSMAVAADDTVLVGEVSGGLSAWQFLDGIVKSRNLLGRAPLTAVSAESGSDGVLTCLSGATKARLWRSTELALEGNFVCGGMSAAAIDPEGSVVAAANAGGRIVVYATATPGSPLWSLPDAHRGAVDCVVFSPSGSVLASTSSRDGTVKMWASRTGESLWEVEEEATHLAFVGHDMLVTGPSLRSAKDGDVLHELGGRGPVAASPDGKFLLTGYEEDVAKLWYLPALSVR